jgi:hypothetical protein
VILRLFTAGAHGCMNYVCNRYLFMTLGQFATAVGAPPRWVLNSLTSLGVPRRYTDELARRLGLAREIHLATGMPLKRAFAVAPEALAVWPAKKRWVVADEGALVSVTVDVERYLSTYATRLSLARSFYAERQRGRPRKRKLRGIALAKWYGVDLSLLVESLKRTPEERLRVLDETVEALKSLKVVGT